MKYSFNGKTITIPDDEIKKGIQILGLTKEESIEMYLEDNGYMDNEEQIALDEIAKTVKINHEASAIDKTQKEKKPRTYVNTDEKNLLFERIKAFLESLSQEVGATWQILKEGKLLEITFSQNPDRPIKIDLVQKKKPKT